MLFFFLPAAFAELAELAPIPVAHVVEVASHLLAAFDDDAFLLLKLLGLLGQPHRAGIELPGLFVDLGLPALEARLSLGQGAAHLGQLSLPGDELLAEGGHGQAVFLAGPVQGELLLPHLFGLDLDLGAQRLLVRVALPGIIMQLGEMFPELLASQHQPVHGALGA